MIFTFTEIVIQTTILVPRVNVRNLHKMDLDAEVYIYYLIFEDGHEDVVDLNVVHPLPMVQVTVYIAYITRII